MQSIPEAARGYVRSIWTAGAILSAASLCLYGLEPFRSNAPSFALFLIFSIFLSACRITLLVSDTEEARSALSLGMTVVFTSVCFLPPPLALWVGLVSGIVSSRRLLRHIMIFNAFLLAMAAYLSGLFFEFLLSQAGIVQHFFTLSTLEETGLILVPAIFVTMVVYYLLNTFGVATVVALSTGQRVLALWKTEFAQRFVLLSYLSSLYFALLLKISFTYRAFLPVGILLAIPIPIINLIYHQLFGSYLEERSNHYSTLSLLLEATSGLVTLEDLETTRSVIVRQVADTMPEVGASLLMLADERSGRLYIAAQHGLSLTDEDWKRISALSFASDRDYLSQILGSDQALLFEIDHPAKGLADLFKEHELLFNNLADPVPPIQNAIGARLRVGDHLLGCLLFLSFDSKRPLQGQHLPLLQTFANQAASTLNNALLYTRLQKSYHELRAAQEQLILAEKMRALGELSSGVAHDFNNILVGILGSAQLAKRNLNQPETLSRRLQVIEQAALDASEIVRRIQDFSRQEREYRFKEVDLNEIVRGAVEMTRHQWETESRRRGIQIDVSTALGNAPPIKGNDAELREVLTNLIVNAVHAMPAGGRLSLRTWAQERSVFLEVRDTGTGMSSEVQRRAFDLFFTTKGIHGSGMGLSITYAIIQRHEGSIQLTSREGAGSAFLIRLPISVAPPAAPPAEALPLSPGNRILVIDDEEPVREVISEMLRLAGQEVTCASSGHEGIDLFKKTRFDLVITDLGMPGLQGTQVVNQIKAISPRTPVALLTGWGGQAAAEEGIRPDITLAKPIREQELVSAVSRLLTSYQHA
ncbi:MAG: response regulator [Armatimonadetes bacterium]|nr:response regulator [Armatimonadota bacterium]